MHIYPIPATPAEISSFLAMCFNNGFDTLPDTVGAPKVLFCSISYGLLHYCLYCFSNAKLKAPPKE